MCHTEAVFKHIGYFHLMLVESRFKSKKQKYITDYFKQ